MLRSRVICREEEYFKEREIVDLGFLGEKRSKSEVKSLCCELIYATFARAKELSPERPDTTSNLARVQEVSLDRRMQSFRSAIDVDARSSARSLA